MEKVLGGVLTLVRTDPFSEDSFRHTTQPVTICNIYIKVEIMQDEEFHEQKLFDLKTETRKLYNRI